MAVYSNGSKHIGISALERMRHIFIMVLLAALFVYHIAYAWPERMVLWLRHPGSKLGLPQDLEGPRILLAAIGAVLLTATTLAFALLHPFPKAKGT